MMLINPYRYGAGGVADPHWANVVLLVNQDQPTLTDMSSSGKTIAYLGSASRSTSEVKYGSGSLEVDGVNTQVYATASSSDFALGTGDFTIEAWAKRRSIECSGICGNIDWSDPTCWAMQINNNSLQLRHGGSYVFFTSSAFALNVWYHFAISRVSGVLYGFIDGALISSSAFTTNLSSSGAVAVGGNSALQPQYNGWDGWLDDVRITKGVGRYASSFTPPSKLPTS